MVVGEIAHERDLMIIGGGPGGYHAAIRAAQLGKNVTLIERDQLGGVCLNKGCIPSKVMAHGAERLVAAKQDEMLGIETTGLNFEISKLLNYKNQVVKQLRDGVEALCKANKVELIKGSAFFLSEDKIGVENEDSYEVYRFNEAIIATGGTPVKMENAPRAERILDIWSIADLAAVPENLIVLGNDYIALEMAMVFQAFGSQVSFILADADFAFDSSINRELNRILKKSGIAVVKGYSVEETDLTEEGVNVVLSGEKGVKTVAGSHMFYSFGTKPQLENLGVDRLKMKVTPDGFIVTDDTGRTSIENIFAIGDVTTGPQLAVKAIKQGKTAAETICGRPSENDMTFIPHIARTRPPIACAGLTEQEAVEQGYEVGVGEFSMSANGFASILGKKEGLVKVVFDKTSDLLLGIHMIGAGAVELISNGIQALEMAARDEDFKFPNYPHPSVNEALLEAVEAFKGEAIHSVPKKQKVKI
ncbi:dihydrolipoyl dehydrogenase [Mesobacillus subterraneus]|uniref:dihydrolipoyl dehydrogenase n=1 Tax=Mesobacillus subterraneus TaxID=285983 RepID=UPI00203B1EF7|nr:dihydrolipoyl dehydrogenase [Mesobacillus subterraneus]MCM3666414.1 dihydrolipoyl dehydrogenase [Mesobacillus subterraneus]MCM3685413.1 dihydrolipoyl dehydrogenase [Mesobacillus subterraneus]